MQTEHLTLALNRGGRSFSVASTPCCVSPNAAVHPSVPVSFARKRLVAQLLRRSHPSGDSHSPGFDRERHTEGGPRLVHDTLGKPHLQDTESPGPAISFSHCRNRLWAALGDPSLHLGLDVADPEDFEGNYPFPRVFTRWDWSTLPDGFEPGTAEAGAFVWSLKEAAVKCVGSGFHWFGPWDLTVCRTTGDRGEGRFRVVFHPHDSELARAMTSVRVVAGAWPAGESWLALAWCDRGSVEPFRQAISRRRTLLP